MPRKNPTSPSIDPVDAVLDRRVGYWTQLEHEQMDAAFVEAMQSAGFSLTPCSTVAGTRAPLLGYRRD